MEAPALDGDQLEVAHGFERCPLRLTFRGLLEEPENVEKADMVGKSTEVDVICIRSLLKPGLQGVQTVLKTAEQLKTVAEVWDMG